MAYYLKYRPQKISDLDLKLVRESLLKTLGSKETPHAFLFVGPKGTGKTSSARILAKSVNCLKKDKDGEPCNKCEVCQLINKGQSMDLIEIDAASNRGIDDIRELRERINLAPSKFKFKVYIIDEVHMLTNEAFNALLKTLEEPPQHAKFVLCTTEPHKLPGTVISRCLRIDFQKASVKELVRSLKKAVKGEGLKIKTEALEMIAKRADGSFRDGVKVLEQLAASGKKISQKSVEELLLRGLGGKSVDEWLILVYERKVKEALEWLNEAGESGLDFRDFSKQVVERLREVLLVKLEVIKGEDLKELENVLILKRLITLLARAAFEVKGAVIDSLPLELAVLEWGLEKESEVEGEERQVEKPLERESQEKVEVKMQTRSGNLSMEEVVSKWQDVLQAVRPHNHSLEALLRAARPSGFDGKRLMIEVFYKFHKERLEIDRYKQVIEEVASKVLVAPIKVRFFLSQKTEKVVQQQAQDDNITSKVEDDIIKTAEEVFGVKVD